MPFDWLKFQHADSDWLILKVVIGIDIISKNSRKLLKSTNRLLHDVIFNQSNG